MEKKDEIAKAKRVFERVHRSHRHYKILRFYLQVGGAAAKSKVPPSS